VKKALCVMLALVACAAARGESSRSPMEWRSVLTNEIARWKAENSAPKGGVADKAARTVRLLAEATGIGSGETVEFFAIGPLSDRAYESMFVTVASPADIAAACDEIGLPRGKGVDPTAARFWPLGEKVAVTVAAWGKDAASRPSGAVTAFLKDVRAVDEGRILEAPFAYTGGARDADGLPVASTNAPCAVFALYNHGPALLQLDGMVDQSASYGRFVTAAKHREGALFEVRIAWDGKRRVKEKTLMLTADNAPAAMRALKEESVGLDVHAGLSFDSSVTVERAASVARAFSMLDGAGVKMNGCARGQFFFRAFLPEEKWRDRAARAFQPFEVRVAEDGSRTFTFVEEDWSGEGLDPVLKPRTTPFREWGELPGLVAKTGEQGSKIAVMFIYAPKGARVADLAPAKEAVFPRISTFYVFGE
jgi:hypothetical protein